MSNSRPPKPALRITGIAFAFALNLFLISVTSLAGTSWDLPVDLLTALILIAAVIAGLLTTWYVGARSGIHAFIGGLVSAPVLGLFVLAGNWQLALLAGSFCALGGIAGEFFQRRRRG
ncbi:MAG: hypothetical protein KF893_25730 [Caldilineaceae bacterium]|nr:hypothetical protein [Caldilineaceae bacterium]